MLRIRSKQNKDKIYNMISNGSEFTIRKNMPFISKGTRLYYYPKETWELSFLKMCPSTISIPIVDHGIENWRNGKEILRCNLLIEEEDSRKSEKPFERFLCELFMQTPRAYIRYDVDTKDIKCRFLLEDLCPFSRYIVEKAIKGKTETELYLFLTQPVPLLYKEITLEESLRIINRYDTASLLKANPKFKNKPDLVRNSEKIFLPQSLMRYSYFLDHYFKIEKGLLCN